MKNNFITKIQHRLFFSAFPVKKHQYVYAKLTCCFLALIATNSVATTPSPQASTDELPRLWQLVDYHDISHPVIGRQGMVVSQKRIASEVGADILRQGGNAVDAAVAVGFALSVVLPRAGNLAGGGFMLVHLADKKKTIAIDYREVAPASAYKDVFLDKYGYPIVNKSLKTLSASGVPGTVAGLHYALENYGSMSWSEVIEPAEKLARNGVVVDDDMARFFYKEQMFLSMNSETCRVFLKANCQPYLAGDLWLQTDLANSLAYLREQGKSGFYQGDIAKKIVTAMEQGDGLITAKDLADYRVNEVAPIRGTYKGFEILTMPPPSSGGVHLIQMLNMFETLDLEDIQQGSAALIHLQTEIFKRAYADRSSFLGDPAFVNVPSKGLTSKIYAKELSKNISRNKITPSSDIKPGKPNKYESPDTTHFSVMDAAGNVVSSTYTLNHNYGNGITIPGTGILLNNTMDDFSVKPGSPNSYGLIGGEANAIAGKKRPLSSMTPTIVLKDGEPYLATGTPGGSKIITSVFQQLVNVLHFEMNIAEATNAPRVHHQWQPDVLSVERNIPADTVDILKAIGYKVKVSSSLGSLQAIMKHNDVFLGAADPRRAGSAAIAVDVIEQPAKLGK
ncbi:gamma-glutamyltransferase [Colwellia psychrerythraea]|uniref:Glutathione hydrolase proenzyme n=1 Tax=Colwellia psychrerythraea TaxID=28229 RepID=A0A099KVQ7_COLPS|nr:gamma-glutamyltransferase [Colwellia psychrerythraea]KGJ94636.1 gamma-glutamyltransferase [Colwellia psychrerythraea]